jgi:hypothetical protein
MLVGRSEAAASTDKDILLDVVALCESDGDGAWPAALDWTAGADLCEEWVGVTCDSTGRHVTRLSLPAPASAADAVDCNASLLAGADWSDLTFLSLMSFSNHNLHGALPAQLLEPPNLLCVRAATGSDCALTFPKRFCVRLIRTTPRALQDTARPQRNVLLPPCAHACAPCIELLHCL